MADISKITLPSGTTYDIKDAVARSLISAGVTFIVAWDGTSAPIAANIPAGVVVIYNGTSTTGELTAANGVSGAFYLIKSATTPTSETLDIYDEYVIVKPVTSDDTTWFWEKIGDTQVNLTDVVTNVTLNKQTDSAIGTDSTFKITQPTISLATGATAGTGVISVATGITSATATGDNVTVLTGLGSPSTKNAIGANSTFTITQPTIALAANTSTATGRVQVATGIKSATAAGDTVNAVTGYTTPTTDTFLKGVKVTSQPTVSLTANTATATGRITYVQAQGSAQTTKLSASASGGGTAWNSKDTKTVVTGYANPTTDTFAKTITPTTSKLTTTSITGVSGSTTASKATAATSQTTVSGAASSTNNADFLANVSVSNEVLTIGAKKLNTQTTTQFTFSDITVPRAATSATTVATGAVASESSGASIVTGVTVGTSADAITGLGTASTASVIGASSTFTNTQPTITVATGTTGDVTVATGINAATVRYLSASASGTAVAADGTADALTALGDPTTDEVLGTGSTITVTPNTTYLGATASGANTAWNSKDTVAAVTGYANPTTDEVLGSGSTITVTPTTTNIKATASGAKTEWNNKDTITVLTNSTALNVTKGS